MRFPIAALAVIGLLAGASPANAQVPQGPPAPPPATPGPACADPRVGGVCDDPARLARLESYRVRYEAGDDTGRIVLLTVLLTGVAGAAGLSVYALTARNQPTGYYVGAGIITGIGALTLGTAAVAILTNTPSKRPTTRQWEADVARTDGDKFFTLYVALPAVLASLVAVPGGIYIMAEKKSFPTAPDGPRVALGAGTALLGGVVLTALGVGVVETVRAGRMVRVIEPTPPKPAWNVKPIVAPVAGGALVGVGGVW